MTKEQKDLTTMIVSQLRKCGITQDDATTLAQETFDVLAQRIFVDLVPRLSEEERFVLRDMADGDLSDEEVDLFLRDIMPQYGDVVNESIQNFFQELQEAIVKK